MKVLGRTITVPTYIQKIPKRVWTAAVAVVLILCILVIAFFLPRKKSVQTYDYNETEQQLADAVIAFLNEYVELPEEAAAKIADAAVENYRIIINSDIDVASDDHTAAIQERLKAAIEENGRSVPITGEDLEGLSLGIAEIVWGMIHAQIETVTGGTDLESDYYYLADSIQTQIDKLEERTRTMQISIQANIKKNDTDMTTEELLTLVEGMTDEEVKKLADSLGISLDDLYGLLNSGGGVNGADKKLEEELQALKKELEKELGEELEKELEKEYGQDPSASNGKNGKVGRDGADGRDGMDGNDGADGRNGTNGRDGQDGKDGKDGKAGRDGDSIFIRYSPESNGRDMTDKPNANTKYMGTYTGASASANPLDYTWTRYSDATITYSDGTVYITQ